MSFSGSIPFFLRFLPGHSTTFIDYLIGKTHGNQTEMGIRLTRDTLVTSITYHEGLMSSPRPGHVLDFNLR
jgi:hypothetical protein